MSARLRRDRKVILAVDPDAAHRRKQPFNDRAFGIVIQGADAALCACRTFPRFPDGRCAALGHRKPSRNLFVFKQLIRRLDIVRREHVQDQRRRKEARAEPPAVMLERLNEPFLCKRGLFLVQKIKVQRTDELRLPVGVKIERVGFHKRAIRFFAAVAVALELRRVRFVSELFRDLCHQSEHMARIRRTDLRMRRDKVLPMEPAVHVSRFRPFAVTLSAVDEILLRLRGKIVTLREQRHVFAAALLHEPGVARHAVVKLLQDRIVPVDLGIPPRDQHAHVRPADRAVHRPHVEVRAAVRRNVRKPPVSALPVEDVVQILLCKRREIEQIRRRREEQLRVAGPAVAFARRTVGRNVQMIALCRPERGVEQPVQQRIRRGKVPRPLEIGIDRDRFDILRIEFDVRFHFRESEAEHRERRLVFVQPLAQGDFDLLQRGRHLLIGKLNVLLREVSGLVEHLAEPPHHALPDPGVHGKRNVTRDILPEIQKLLPVRRGRDRRTEPFMLGHRHVV